MSSILNNTAGLQRVLETLQNKASGTVLPELNNEGTAVDLLINKELIDGNGNIIIGSMPNNGNIVKTMDGLDVKSVTIPAGYTSGGSISLDDTIDNEADEQADLIAQIKNIAENLPSSDGGSDESNYVTIYNNTDHFMVINGFYCECGVNTDIIEPDTMFLVASSGSSEDERLFIKYTGLIEDDDGNLHEEVNGYSFPVIEHEGFYFGSFGANPLPGTAITITNQGG